MYQYVASPPRIRAICGAQGSSWRRFVTFLCFNTPNFLNQEVGSGPRSADVFEPDVLTLEIFVMKKSLVALAVLAASGAAMAQSSVTLYGLIDTFATDVKFGNGTGVKAPSATTAVALAGTTQGLLQSGGVNGSRWGLKGSEDLGGGLKANFDLQQGIAIDTGAYSSALAFDRAAWVGFSGDFGAVKLGRVPTAFYDAEGGFDGVFNSALSAGAVAFRTASGADTSFEKSNYGSRFDNSARYETPNLSGFTGVVQYGLTENKALAVP